ATRRESVGRGLAALEGEHDTVLVHDGARPFLSERLISRVAEACAEGPAIPGLPLTDTVKLIGEGGRVLSTLDREMLRAVQTPQGFPLDMLIDLHEQAARDGTEATDDALLAEAAGIPVRVVAGDPLNLKVTTLAELALSEWMVRNGDPAAEGIEVPRIATI
ncbi:MAG: IspD/TarI family cytidylyltransferase, partial [Gemmatimonadota bacterium]